MNLPAGVDAVLDGGLPAIKCRGKAKGWGRAWRGTAELTAIVD